MAISEEQIRSWLQGREDEHVEFKTAERQFDADHKLPEYCVALANEGGGHLVLGVSPKMPRQVVGSQAFRGALEKEKHRLLDQIHLRVGVEELLLSEGRVVVFSVPSRPIGVPLEYRGTYWMRSGESLVGMTPEMLRVILDEGSLDYSAEICPEARCQDLAPEAVAVFQTQWARKANRAELAQHSPEQILHDAELMRDGRVTYAALVLFGTHEALGRLMPHAEIVFEYRSEPANVRSQKRKEYRQGFFLSMEDLERTIGEHNDLQHFQDGFFLWDIPTFDPEVTREAVLNAVVHRDYRLQGSVFVFLSPRQMEIVSPGGFPPGVTAENILDRTVPRNRRIAEAMAKCGLVERGGQGLDMMYRKCIESAKAVPDFSGTDDYQVRLLLRGSVQDVRILRFLEEVGQETLNRFSVRDLLVLNCVLHGSGVPRDLQARSEKLAEAGLLEAVGRGRGTKWILSRRFHAFLGEKGAYTRKRGLDKETNKALLLKHIQGHTREGSPMTDLQQVLPALSRRQVQILLGEMRDEGLIESRGRTKGTRWFATRAPQEERSGRFSSAEGA